MDFEKYVCSGQSIDVAVTKKVASGDLYTVGALNGMAMSDAEVGERITLALRGVYSFKKATGALAVGEMVKPDSDPTAVAKATDPTKSIGICVEAADSGAGYARIAIG